MGDVYDLFSRRNLSKVRQNTAENDREAAEHGRYVGVLPKYGAENIRGTIQRMESKRAQIEPLMESFKIEWQAYFYMIVTSLSLLGVNIDEFDPERQELYVDKDGHCWIVETQG